MSHHSFCKAGSLVKGYSVGQSLGQAPSEGGPTRLSVIAEDAQCVPLPTPQLIPTHPNPISNTLPTNIFYPKILDISFGNLGNLNFGFV
jgi:hypothetical protein